MKTKLAYLLSVGLVFSTAHAACPSWDTTERFIINGGEVTDKRTGLVWKRCSEGQTLGGDSCTGTASVHHHQAALSLAKSQNNGNSPTGWRLPNVKELASLADRGCSGPAIDSTAFPNTPWNGWYWSSSPYVGVSGDAWGVDFGMGDVHTNHFGDRYSEGHVRLVRSSQ
jgi:hypothetical protein